MCRAMTQVTSLRRPALAASIAIAVVCLMNVWATHIYRPTDIDARLQVNLYRQLVLLVAGVAYLAWLGRARRNLLAFKGEERQYSPGWTLGAWLIPFANLVMPALVTADIVRGSTTEPAAQRKLITIVWVWWACYLGGAVAVLGLNDSAAVNLPRLLGSASQIAAGVLISVLMFKIAAAQQARFSATAEPNPADFPTFTVDDVRPAEAN
jgi:hypothetical protein